MVTANDLIMIFIGLEISSISSYVLAGYLRDDKRNNEAALKYFLLGSFATAFFLYGVALILRLHRQRPIWTTIRAALDGPNAPFAGIRRRSPRRSCSSAWASKSPPRPSRSGRPTCTRARPRPSPHSFPPARKPPPSPSSCASSRPRFEPIGMRWEPLVWGSALLSMTIGNFAALLQSNIKRMLAYSSIAHAGYVLVALTARSETGTAAAMFYLAAYALMNIGAFAVVAHLSGKGEQYVSVDDFSGLGQKQPFVAAMLTIFLLSLIGVPLTGGFFGKFYIFKAALDSHLVWLTVLGLLNSAVAAYYYLRILVMMYMHEPGKAVTDVERLSPSLTLALIVPALGTLFLGIFPNWVLELAGRSAAAMK